MKYNTTPAVAVVIVTYNGAKWIDKCLSSLFEAMAMPYVIVIDNGSTDGTIKKIKGGFKQVELIESKENLGFGRANNIGIKKAIEKGAEYVFLLNQDAYLYKGSIESAINIFIENKNIGIVSPVHFAGDGINLDFGFYAYISPKKTPALIGNAFSRAIDRKYYETDFINAAAWVVKASVFEDMGGFHPVFEHYSEDDEFVIRLKKNNLSVCIDPNFSIIHDRLQNRVDNPYFQRYKRLQRNTIIRYFKGENESVLRIFQRFLKASVVYFFTLKIKESYLTIKYFFKTIKSIKSLKAMEGQKLIL